jgi:hypothetical protein
MMTHTLILGLVVIAANGPPGAAAEPASAADRITMRDGTVVLGLVTSATSGARGSVGFLVRRDWAEKNAGNHLANWDRSTLGGVRRAAAVCGRRLADWRKERVGSPGVGPDDRIVPWIDREMKRMANPEDLVRSALVSVRLPRSEVRALSQQSASVQRLLRLAWLSELSEPETMPVDQMKNALAVRGFSPDAVAKRPPAPLDRLLPPTLETEALWQARRAATEVTIDPDLRFIRFQDFVLPEPQPGAQPFNPNGLATAVSGLQRLLNPDAANGQVDPLLEKLQSISARGRSGSVVTRLTIAPDMSDVSVESTLWVRTAGGRWAPSGSKSAVVRPDDLRPEAGRDLAVDPQVKSALRMVETIGGGAIPQELKDRSLRIGAATQKALSLSRSALNQDLDQLMLPVMEPVREAAERGPRKPAAEPAPKSPPRRRSVLGPPDR